MIKNLKQSDNKKQVSKSTLILRHVLGGKAHVLELLEKLIKKEKDETIRKRLLKVKDDVSKWEEKEEPLY